MPLRGRIRAWIDDLDEASRRKPGAESVPARRSRVRPEAEQAFRSLWTDTVRADSTRHPFHREVLDDLDALLDRVGSIPGDTLITVNGIDIRWYDLPRRYPRVSRRLTEEWMRSYVITEVEGVAAVADSTDFLASYADQRHSGPSSAG